MTNGIGNGEGKTSLRRVSGDTLRNLHNAKENYTPLKATGSSV